MLAGCAQPEGPAPDAATDPAPTAPAPTPTPTPTMCAAGTAPGAARVAFSAAYVEQETPFDGGVAAEFLEQQHTLRRWTDMRIVAHRDVTWTGEPGFEVVTVDATNGTATWRLGLEYMLPARCVGDRAADDEKMCAHWGSVADVLEASFDEAGGWSASATGGCEASGGE